MSTLDKMLIKGIRSFGPDNTNVITFYRPLTLVVGANGAGKTTIIECLKNACTGELPPNSRSGQSFVHDPKIEGLTETKGQIKLRFRTATGKDVVCIRSFQLTQKASKMEYKAIESVLQTINVHTGEKVCLSYRCADMDREVPQLMGVSKAILENVIFVHQDDANWPLAEGSVLKKKFDDIFSATRYTKALDSIKKLHKEQAQDIKTQKLKLENVQTLKDAAHKLLESIANDQQKASVLKSQVDALEPQISIIQSKIDSMEASLREIRELKTEINRKDGGRNEILKAKMEQYNALEEEIEESDEELMEWKGQFDKRLADSESEIRNLLRQADSAKTQYDTLTNLIRDAATAVGKFEGEENAHLQDRRQVEVFLQQLLGRYQLGDVVPPLDDQTIERCISKLNVRLQDLRKDHGELVALHERELSGMSKKHEQAVKSYSDATGRRDAKLSQKRTVESRLDELSREITDISSTEAELRKCEEKLASMEREVRKLVQKMDEKHFDEVINQEKINKQLLEQKVKALRQEKNNLDRESDDRHALRLKKEDLAVLQRQLKKLMDENKEKFRQVLKCQPKDPKTVKSDVDIAFSNFSKAYDDILNKSRDADMRVAHARAMLDDAKATLAKHMTERDAKKRLLMNKLDMEVEAFPVRLKQACEAKDNKKSQHDLADGMRRMFDPFEKVARTNHQCPVCERKFTTEEEDEFVRKQRQNRANTSERLQGLAAQFSMAESAYLQMEKLRPLWEDYHKLQNELIPASEKVVAELSQEVQNNTESQDDVSCLLAQSKAELGLASDLRFTAQVIDGVWANAQSAENEISALERKLDFLSSASRSAEDVGEELEKHEKQLEELNRNIDKLKEDYDYMKDDLANCTRRRHAEEMRKAELEKNVERTKALRGEESSLRTQKNEIEQQIELETEQLAPLSREKERYRKELEEMRSKFKQEEDASRNVVSAFDKEVHSLVNFWQKILRYIESHKTENLQTAKKKLSELQSRKDDEEAKYKFYDSEVHRVQQILDKQKAIARNISDNIKYREACAREQRFLQEIRSLEEKMHSFGAEADLDSELKKALKERQTVVGEVNRYRGTIGVHEANIAKNGAELKHAQYKNVDQRYRSQLIQLKTTEMANKDLDKYYNAVDRALMRFHTMKMEEINKMIKELWQQTYRGQDIDYIEIRADAEGAGTRSYSYRVVMMSGGAELEMRGRCSAGQKVLAALIIRLALAETFCLNCGILTLDEPTTNLDAANSESFAAALLRIMEDRRAQENFQLIVITHDERFAQLIGQRQLAEKYYRVSKDASQHSLIEVQDIFG